VRNTEEAPRKTERLLTNIFMRLIMSRENERMSECFDLGQSVNYVYLNAYIESARLNYITEFTELAYK
jgi:hypothetical protein